MNDSVILHTDTVSHFYSNVFPKLTILVINTTEL